MHQQPQQYGIQSNSVAEDLTATHEYDDSRSSGDRRNENVLEENMNLDTLARTAALHANAVQMNTFNTMAPWPPFSPTFPLSSSVAAATAAAAAAAMPLSFEAISLASSPTVNTNSATYNDVNAASSVLGLIEEPHVNDVLCGRGGSINSHPGNRRFRDWVIQRKESYMLAKSKSDKTRVTADIMNLVQNQTPPGRFLQKYIDDHGGGGARRGRSKSDSQLGGWWVEIDELKALAKCSQALREGAPAFRALHKTEKKGIHSKKSTSERSRLSATCNKLRLQQQHHQAQHEKMKELRKPPSPITSVDMRKVAHSMHVDVPPAPAIPNAFPPIASPTAEIDETERELNVLYPVSSSIFETESNDNVRSISSFPLLHLGDYTASIDDVAKAIPTPTTTEGKPIINTPILADKQTSGEWFRDSLMYSPFTPFVSPGLTLTPHADGPRRTPPGGGWCDAISFLPNLSPMPPGYGTHNEEVNPKRAHSLSSFSEGDYYSDDSFKNPFEGDNGNTDSKCKATSMPQGYSSGLNHDMMYAEAPQSRPFLPMPPHRQQSMERLGLLHGGNNSFHHNSSWHKTTSRASSISSLSQRSISNLNNHTKRKSIS